MNKKRLSVVMAGAMLASSVAPVLAATATEEQKLALGQRGLLIDALRTKMESLKFEAGDEAGKSVYGYTLTTDGKDDSETVVNEVASMETALKGLNASNIGNIIKIYEKEYQKDSYGRITSKTQTATQGDVEKIEKKADLETLKNEIDTSSSNKFIKETKWEDDSKKEKLIVVLNAVKDVNASEIEYKTVELTVGDEIIDITKPLDKDGKPLDTTKDADVQKFEKFESKRKAGSSVGTELTGRKLLATVKIVKDNDGSVANNFLVSDLFDGLKLTEEGSKLFELIKYDKTGEGIDYTVSALDTTTIKGIASFTVEFKDTDNSNKVVKTITVRGTDEKKAEILQSYLDKKKFTVGELAGEDRYETAAKIAKEQAELTTVAANGHIVLVNGNALVDGLSAAPLAQALVSGTNAAPVLLTEKDGLPSATKAYIRDLLNTVPVGQIKNITIDLVGGEGVLSESLVDELKGYGFKVKRFGGETREETSLEVARKIKSESSGINNLYVVGATGEADAMSIAPIASTVANKGAIIVSDFNGLSREALREIEDFDANVTIVGGDACVSEADEAKLKEIAKENNSGKTTKRVSGTDRKDTNAKIIKEYYNLTTTDAVVLAKDDVLVDALTAANLASQKNAPIVLATSELSESQINEINLKAGQAKALYQIGHGVKTPVLQKLADLLKLPVKAK